MSLEGTYYAAHDTAESRSSVRLDLADGHFTLNHGQSEWGCATAAIYRGTFRVDGDQLVLSASERTDTELRLLEDETSSVAESTAAFVLGREGSLLRLDFEGRRWELEKRPPSTRSAR